MDIELELKKKRQEMMNVPTKIQDLGTTDLVNLQMVLVTSSMNHEYARKAYEESHSYATKQELLNSMTNFKEIYFTAREKIASANPELLPSIEEDLKFEKITALTEHSIH